MTDVASGNAGGGHSVFVPLLLVAWLLLTLMAYQTWERVDLRDSLRQAIAGQQVPLTEARRIRAQLDSLGAGTARLSRAGNRNAAAIETDLEKIGVLLNPDAMPAGP